MEHIYTISYCRKARLSLLLLLGVVFQQCLLVYLPFPFVWLGLPVLEERLRGICTAEDVAISDEAVTALITVSEGDLRRAITTLQSAARLQAGVQLNQEHICEITGTHQGHTCEVKGTHQGHTCEITGTDQGHTCEITGIHQRHTYGSQVCAHQRHICEILLGQY